MIECRQKHKTQVLETKHVDLDRLRKTFDVFYTEDDVEDVDDELSGFADTRTAAEVGARKRKEQQEAKSSERKSFDEIIMMRTVVA